MFMFMFMFMIMDVLDVEIWKENEKRKEGRKADVAVESVLGEGTSGGEWGERVRLEKPRCYTIKFFFYLVSMATGGRERETKMCGREGERGENQWSAFIYIIRDDLMPDISSFLSLFSLLFEIS